jgi:hypothetical protein
MQSFAPPASIINGCPHLAVFPLPPHLVGNVIFELPLPCLCRPGAMPSSPCPCFAETIFASAPLPPQLSLQYPYLLAITINVRPSHWMCPLLPSLSTLIQHCKSMQLALTTLRLTSMPMPLLYILLPPLQYSAESFALDTDDITCLMMADSVRTAP